MAYTTIDKSSLHFNTKLYTGTGSSNALTGVGFQPDWTWIKVRSEANNHELYDAVRGVTKRIYSDLNSAEDTNTAGLTAFGTDGFTVNTGGAVNGSSKTYVAWNWKANGQGSSNTDGTINTTYTSVNTTSGFSISQYTGTGSNATIGHGLGAAPELVIIKKTNTTSDWVIGQNGLGGWNYVLNFTTSGRANQANQFQSTAPSSSLITLGTESQVNGSGATFICYAFAPKTGFSKFGSYSGNGNGNGAFIYTGFKPKFLIIKNYSGNGDNWIMLTNELSSTGSNVVNNYLKPDENAAETTASSNYPVDFFSTGFKLRGTDSGYNNGSSSYIYMAFAEAPLVTSGNIPATAR